MRERVKKRETKLTNKKKLGISAVLLTISAVLFFSAKYIDDFSNIYYKYIYLSLVNTVTRVFSLFPFSIFEIMVIGFIILIFVRIILYVYLVWNKQFSLKQIAVRATSNIIIYISIFSFLNIATLGVNAYKLSFVQLTGLKVQDNSEERLIKLCNYLKDRLNEVDGKVERDENGLLKLGDNVQQEGIDSMENLGKTYPYMQGFYPRPKPYFFSKVMSYQLLEGETDFTMEANYNNDMPKLNVPSTICHELSHVRGFNNEDEANYISFLACINSESYEYQYSGLLMAYSYCMNDLYDFNLDAFKKINGELSNNVRAELINDSLYWNKYRGQISKLHNEAYDQLLKASGQENGIKSYNAVVKLLISGYEVQF